MFAATHVVAKNVADLFEKPNASSPLDTQAVLGEAVQLEEKEDGFLRVITGIDLYSAWIDSRWLVTARDVPKLQSGVVKRLFAEMFSKPDRSSELITKLVMGTKILFADEQDSSIYVKLVLPGGQAGYVQRSSVQTKPLSLVPHSSEKVLADISTRTTQIAKQLIGTPYLWGGTTPFGIDCSGLVQLCYKMCGISLRRNSYMQMDDKRFLQVESGKPLSQADLRPGDLLGFAPAGKVNHIAIALGDGRFIHASGNQRRAGVFIDSCKDQPFGQIYLKAVRLSSAAPIESA